MPKDSKQLLSNFKDVPQSLIAAIVESNTTRKNFITDEIIKLNPKTVGIYKLSMKEGSDNFRFSAILDIIKNLSLKGIEILIHEPIIDDARYDSMPLINDLNEFKKRCDLIICNRKSRSLEDVEEKIYSRDIFNTN